MTLSTSFDTSATWRPASMASRQCRAPASGLPVASTSTSKGRSMTTVRSAAAMWSPAAQAAVASCAVAQSRMRRGSTPTDRSASAASSASRSTLTRARIIGTRSPCARKLRPKLPAPTMQVSTGGRVAAK
jgi:hypothetical protein